jgi:hypothetical protein
MIHFKRPPEPSSFAAKVNLTKNSLLLKVKSFDLNRSDGQPNPGNQKLDFPDLWKDFKGEFSKAQFGKCGYCESMVVNGQPGDVEHYAPKSEVWELNLQAVGQEKPYLSNVENRKYKILSERGYWWLAYDWNNYLLACHICNRTWKGAIFPVRKEHRQLPPDPDHGEEPLLLNPFDVENPGKFLRFTDFGQIETHQKDEFGLATIETCGLDRQSLVRARKEKARRAYRLVQELNTAIEQGDETARDRALKDFLELGNEEYEFAGMVRIIFEEQCGISWEDLGFLAS